MFYSLFPSWSETITFSWCAIHRNIVWISNFHRRYNSTIHVICACRCRQLDAHCITNINLIATTRKSCPVYLRLRENWEKARQFKKGLRGSEKRSPGQWLSFSFKMPLGFPGNLKGLLKGDRSSKLHFHHPWLYPLFYFSKARELHASHWDISVHSKHQESLAFRAYGACYAVLSCFDKGLSNQKMFRRNVIQSDLCSNSTVRASNKSCNLLCPDVKWLESGGKKGVSCDGGAGQLYWVYTASRRLFNVLLKSERDKSGGGETGIWRMSTEMKFVRRPLRWLHRLLETDLALVQLQSVQKAKRRPRSRRVRGWYELSSRILATDSMFGDKLVKEGNYGALMGSCMPLFSTSVLFYREAPQTVLVSWRETGFWKCECANLCLR